MNRQAGTDRPAGWYTQTDRRADTQADSQTQVVRQTNRHSLQGSSKHFVMLFQPGHHSQLSTAGAGLSNTSSHTSDKPFTACPHYADPWTAFLKNVMVHAIKKFVCVDVRVLCGYRTWLGVKRMPSRTASTCWTSWWTLSMRSLEPCQT